MGGKPTQGVLSYRERDVEGGHQGFLEEIAAELVSSDCSSQMDSEERVIQYCRSVAFPLALNILGLRGLPAFLYLGNVSGKEGPYSLEPRIGKAGTPFPYTLGRAQSCANMQATCLQCLLPL